MDQVWIVDRTSRGHELPAAVIRSACPCHRVPSQSRTEPAVIDILFHMRISHLAALDLANRCTSKTCQDEVAHDLVQRATADSPDRAEEQSPNV